MTPFTRVPPSTRVRTDSQRQQSGPLRLRAHPEAKTSP